VSTTPETAPAFDFTDWLRTGTVAKQVVVLHNDRAIPGRLDLLERERATAVRAAADAEASITEGERVAEIDAEIDALAAAWHQSKETWTVRALSEDEVAEISKRHPVPSPPAQPKRGTDDAANKAAESAHEQAMLEWAEQGKAIRDEANLDLVATAFVSLSTAAGSTTTITADALRELRKIPGRQSDFQKLLDAAVTATQEDPELPAPFLQRTSRSSRA
jgi:hypothetical protein